MSSVSWRHWHVQLLPFVSLSDKVSTFDFGRCPFSPAALHCAGAGLLVGQGKFVWTKLPLAQASCLARLGLERRLRLGRVLGHRLGFSLGLGWAGLA